MSVRTYDSSFGYRQGEIARLGDRAMHKPMSADERQKFQNSPFMAKMKEIDNKCWLVFSQRDKNRAARDPKFKPSEADFEAPKAHTYDKAVNYYKVLGVDELASNDDVKRAYRKLSLVYHPDKMSGKSQEEKDESVQIFLEIKNAYKTLSDDPTRRQYDYDRDHDDVAGESYGRKRQDRPSFDALVALHKLAEKLKENQKAPGRTVAVPVLVRLEKFVHGGQKSVARTRRVRDRAMDCYADDRRTFRCDLPAGAAQPWHQDFARQGDHHDDTEPDTLRFTFTAKAHGVVVRLGQDLEVRGTVPLGEAVSTRPHLAVEAPSVAGRHLILWGRNPFFGEHSEGLAELRTVVRGQGVGAEGCLRFTACARLPATAAPRPPTPSATGPPGGRGPPGGSAAGFLAEFGLGPPWGLGAAAGAARAAPPWHLPGGAAEAPCLQRRAARRSGRKLVRELELQPLGEPLPLATRPPSALVFFGPAAASPTRYVFGVCLSCPSGGKKRGAEAWELLKRRLLPLLRSTAFCLLPAARAAWARALPRFAEWADLAPLARMEPPPTPWKRLGDLAYERGDLWQAAGLYSRRLEEQGAEAVAQEHGRSGLPEEAAVALGGADDLEVAKVLSNRAACLHRLGDFRGAAADARRAAGLAPRWWKPWSRLGLALGQLSDDGAPQEAMQACLEATALEPSRENVASLLRAAATRGARGAGAAHAEKEAGNEAHRAGQLGVAVARYTTGLAELPEAPEGEADTHALLRAALHANRCAARTLLRLFDAAAEDGRLAVAAKPDVASFRVRLGVALLGRGQPRLAYVEFARALQLSEDHKGAKKGRSACLKELAMWRSDADAQRLAGRFQADAQRPRGSSRVFALSDVHFEQRPNEDWVHEIDDLAFQADVLIVAGNLAMTAVGIERALTTLRQKFRRVFFTPGDHDLQIHQTEHARYPDSMAKFIAIISLCDDLGVDICPAPIWDGLLVVPILSWYDVEYDVNDPFPDPNVQTDAECKWPMDADTQVWRYMMKLNHPFMQKVSALGSRFQVVTFSHWLPRQNLPFDRARKGQAKRVGCETIDEQARAIGSRLHVFGHGRTATFHRRIQGVCYVHQPLRQADGTDTPRRLCMVHDGQSPCMQEWNANGEPPLGFVKRLQYTAFYTIPDMQEMDARRLRSIVASFKIMTGISCSFSQLGSRLKDKGEFTAQVWQDLNRLSFEATHGLLIVADDVEALKNLLSSTEYKTSWLEIMRRLARRSISFSTILGLDLAYDKKADPTLLVFALRLDPQLAAGGEAYQAMEGAVESINRLPGGEGKLSAAFHATGFGRWSAEDLRVEVGATADAGLGFTHCFTVAVDVPASFKMLAASKTFGRWRASYEPLLARGARGEPAVAAFAVPIEFGASAAAPPSRKRGARQAPRAAATSSGVVGG